MISRATVCWLLPPQSRETTLTLKPEDDPR